MSSACALYISLPNVARTQSIAMQLSNVHMHTVHHCGAVVVSGPLAAWLYGEDCITTEGSYCCADLNALYFYIAGCIKVYVCCQTRIARMPTCTPNLR